MASKKGCEGERTESVLQDVHTDDFQSSNLPEPFGRSILLPQLQDGSITRIETRMICINSPQKRVFLGIVLDLRLWWVVSISIDVIIIDVGIYVVVHQIIIAVSRITISSSSSNFITSNDDSYL